MTFFSDAPTYAVGESPVLTEAALDCGKEPCEDLDELFLSWVSDAHNAEATQPGCPRTPSPAHSQDGPTLHAGSQPSASEVSAGSGDTTGGKGANKETTSGEICSGGFIDHEEEDDQDDDEESLERKRAARLQRNRESAQLSRQRKKSQLDDLDRKCRSFQAQNQELHVLVARLAAENQTLRSQLQRYQGHQVGAAGMFLQQPLLPVRGPDGSHLQPKVALPPRRKNMALPVIPMPAPPCTPPGLMSPALVGLGAQPSRAARALPSATTTVPMSSPLSASVHAIGASPAKSAGTPSKVRPLPKTEEEDCTVSSAPSRKRVKRAPAKKPSSKASSGGTTSSPTATTTVGALLSVFALLSLALPGLPSLPSMGVVPPSAPFLPATVEHASTGGRVLTSLSLHLDQDPEFGSGGYGGLGGANRSAAHVYSDFTTSAVDAAKQLARTTLRLISSANSTLAELPGDVALRALNAATLRGRTKNTARRMGKAVPKTVNGATLKPNQMKGNGSESINTTGRWVGDSSADGMLALQKWVAQGGMELPGEGDNQPRGAFLPWDHIGGHHSSTGQWMGSPLHPVMCTEVFTFAADATKNPHLAEQHLRQVVPSSQAQAPSSLESRASSTGATLQLAYPSHYTEPSARSTAKTSQYTQRTSSASEDSENTQEQKVHSQTNSASNGMIVSMLVPELGNTANGKTSSEHSKPDNKAPQGLVQAFVMVFMSQTAQYVTYSCHLPLGHSQ